MTNDQYFSTRGFANGNATSTLLYETLLYETLRERQAQGIALRVACFHEVVRQSSGQRAAQYKSVQVTNDQ
ncbi:MAG: hypothetical protein ACYTXA_11030 [Nostoc sp.]